MTQRTEEKLQKENRTLKIETVLHSDVGIESRHFLLIAHTYEWIPDGLYCGAVWIEPFAVVVVEEGMEYALSLSDKPVTFKQLLNELPGLYTMIQNVRVGAKLLSQVDYGLC